MSKKTSLIPFFLFTVIFLLLNTYVLSGIKVFSTNPLVSLSFLLLVALVTLSLIYAFKRMSRRGMDLFFKVATHAFLILISIELVFALVLLPGDVYYLISHTPRSIYWVSSAAFFALIMLLLFIYGMIRGKYAYRVVKHELYFEDLPEAFDGFTITQISDIHAGSFNSSKAVQKGINMVNAQHSDLFVFTGDMVNNKASEIEPWLGHFSQIKAPYGQFSVLGNHDYGDYVPWKNDHDKKENLKKLKDYHAKLGFKLLLDEHISIHKDGQQIILAGVENWGLGFGMRGDLKKALNNTAPADFKILLSHDPSHWESEVKQYPVKVHLTLAGHTHGMQFGIEALGIKWSPVKYRYAHWAGIKQEHNRYLNINRGFGFIGFSGRIGIWPEITVITLRKLPPASSSPSY